MITIHYPIWKTRSIGVALHRLGNGTNEIEILYKNKLGERIYPHIYTITRAEIASRRYPTQDVRGVKLVIIPIDDMKIKERTVYQPDPAKEREYVLQDTMAIFQ